MDELFIGIFFYSNFVIVISLYLLLLKYRSLIGFQLGMNISIVIGGMIALMTGVLFIFQYPFHYTLVTIGATLVGMVVGGVFGALFDYQTFLTGLINGMMLGLMAPMIGAVITQKALFIIVIEFIFCIIIGVTITSVIRS